MRLQVAAFRQLDYGGTLYRARDEIDVPDESAANWLRTGLVVPADGVWPEGVYIDPAREAAPPDSETEPSNTHPECDPGIKPAGARGMQICPVAGCPCPTWRGKCRAHARSSSAGKRYRDSYTASSSLRARWSKASKAYRREHELCESERCAAIAAPLRPAATEVDHIDGLGLQGPRAFDETNWQSLCKSCHSRKTAGESFGR